MSRNAFRLISLLCTILLLMPTTALAGGYDSLTTRVNERNVIDYVGKDAGITFSAKAELIVQDSADDTLSYLAIRDVAKDGMIRITVVAPYRDVNGGLTPIDAYDYLDNLVRVQMREKGIITPDDTFVPPVNFADMSIYLNYYYTTGNSVGLGGYLIRPVQLYAVETSGSYDVTDFDCRVHVNGALYSVNPLKEVQWYYDYVDRLSVTKMTRGVQYSRMLNSISPYYVYVGSGSTPSPIHEVSWGGYYNSQVFQGYYPLH